MNKQYFRFGFIVLTSFTVILCFFAFSVVALDNPLMFSWHPDFFYGLLYGYAYFGCLYLGWIKKEKGIENE